VSPLEGDTLVDATFFFEEAPHPPYSPDLSPSDFFLFGYLKQYLRGMVFAKIEDLQKEVDRFLSTLTADMLQRVFLHWIVRCKTVIATGGEYFRRCDIPSDLSHF
jgi:hypothetical protein